MEEDDKTEKKYSKKPFFNMAEASLKRIDMVLIQLGMVSASFEISELLKQKKRISLVKTLFQYALPLRPELTRIKDEIFNFKIKKISIISLGLQKTGEICDPEVDKKIDQAINKIVLELKNYCMPEIQEEDEDEY